MFSKFNGTYLRYFIKLNEEFTRDRVMDDREMLLFEISFYESKIALFREMIFQFEKDIAKVRNELSSLDAEHVPDQPI
jgi:hypothetical protein